MKFALLCATLPFLYEAAGDNPEAGGSPVTPPVAPPTGTPAPAEGQTAPTPAPAPLPEAGLLDHALAIGKSKGELMASLREMNTRNGALTAELARLTTERDTLAARVTALEAERVQIQAALTASEAENKSVEAGTTQALAALNIPRPELPAPASQGGGSKRERLESELATCTDPVQRGRLSVQIWDEMKSGGKN